MHTGCTETPYPTDAAIVTSQSALDQMISTSEGGGGREPRHLDANAELPGADPVWPRVWPGL